MSTQYFGLWRGRANRKWFAAAKKIAEKHGAWIQNDSRPGSGCTGWFGWMQFSGFDISPEAAVMADLEAAGLWRDNAPVSAKCSAWR